MDVSFGHIDTYRTWLTLYSFIIDDDSRTIMLFLWFNNKQSHADDTDNPINNRKNDAHLRV